MLFYTWQQQLWSVVLLATVALAVWRGGRTERWAALACMVAAVASTFGQNIHDWISPQWGLLWIDVGLFLALTALALTSRRIWPLFAAAFELVGLLIHGVIVVDDQVRALAYHRGLVIFSYLVLIAVACGALTTPAAERLPLLRRRPRPEPTGALR